MTTTIRTLLHQDPLVPIRTEFRSLILVPPPSHLVVNCAQPYLTVLLQPQHPTQLQPYDQISNLLNQKQPVSHSHTIHLSPNTPAKWRPRNHHQPHLQEEMSHPGLPLVLFVYMRCSLVADELTYFTISMMNVIFKLSLVHTFVLFRRWELEK